MKVTSEEYLQSGMVPESPNKKDYVVGMRCTDQRGRLIKNDTKC